VGKRGVQASGSTGSAPIQQGTVIRAIDKAGRILVRGQVPEDCHLVYMTYGTNGQILMMPPATWEQFAARIAAMDQDHPDTEDLYRFQIAPVQECPIDSAGRARVAEALRSWAGLDDPKDEAQIVNMGPKGFEIWSVTGYKEALRDRAEAMRQAYAKAAERRNSANSPATGG
jgi:division/cell wall cluster transcriptional repressor MraZ